MSGKASSCWTYGNRGEPGDREVTKNDRKLAIADSFIPDLPGPAAEAQYENLFCRIHPCTFLELRFTDTYETCWECPECEREAYIQRIRCELQKMGGTAADSIRSGKRFSERGTGVAYFPSAGGR